MSKMKMERKNSHNFSIKIIHLKKYFKIKQHENYLILKLEN